MITREEFIAKVNSFNLGEEQTAKCIEYYDNPSKSASKEKVVDEANAEDLVKTVNKWYGIKHSTKEKKPRTKKNTVKLEELLEQINGITDSVIATNDEDDIDDLRSCLTSNVNKIDVELDKIKQAYLNEKKEIEKAIKEFNKKHNVNYTLSFKIEETTEE